LLHIVMFSIQPLERTMPANTYQLRMNIGSPRSSEEIAEASG